MTTTHHLVEAHHGLALRHDLPPRLLSGQVEALDLLVQLEANERSRDEV